MSDVEQYWMGRKGLWKLVVAGVICWEAAGWREVARCGFIEYNVPRELVFTG